MKYAIQLGPLIPAVLLMLPITTRANEPPHDASNGITCIDCHDMLHGPMLPRGEEQEAVCKVCHSETGSVPQKADVANHVVRDGTIVVDCGSCHNPHHYDTVSDPHTGASGTNLSLIRRNTYKYVTQAKGPAIFLSRPESFSFSEAPYTGICQSCHTETSHHTNAGFDPYHLEGAVCTTCHLHKDGFLPGGCTQCHAESQGGHRIIVGASGDFAMITHHVRGEVQDDDCKVCHYIGDHGSGTVKLRDPDLGTALIYEFDPADPAGVEQFCLNCHDSDGAQADLATEPFSDGETPPDLKTGNLWENSAHKLFAYTENDGRPITCLGDGATSGCHANAHGADNTKILAGEYFGDDLQQMCYGCHTEGKVMNDALANNRPGGYSSADDIQEAFSKSVKHSLGATFTVGESDFSLQCTSCHNPHIATGKYWDAEANLTPVTRPDFSDPDNNPRAMGQEVWGDEAGEKTSDFAAQGSGSGGWYFSQARGGYIAIDQPAQYVPPKAGSGYEAEFSGNIMPDYTTLCLDCHSNRVSDAIPPVNWGQGISCTDNSVDPPNQRVECGADHGLGRAGMPSYVSDEGAAGFWGSSGNPDAIFQMNYVTRGRHNGHFMRWPYDSAERAAGINFVLACTDCHEAHGSSRGSMIRERLNVNGNGDCGTGGDADPNGENCTDGSNWNSFCNVCHYYYGGQHAGMSCGNASCHEANSIHRIIHTVDSGANTQLKVTAAGYEAYFQRPDFTPEIYTVEGNIDSDELIVTFTGGVYANSDLSGSLDVDDFWLFDVGDNNPREITNVSHTSGESVAILTMSASLSEEDLTSDILAARGASVWAWYEGGYENWATGVMGAQAVSAGPWPATIIGAVQLLKVESAPGYHRIRVTFSKGVYSNSDGTGALTASDFDFTDLDDSRVITEVEHYPGDAMATLSLSSSFDNADDIGVDNIAAVSYSIFNAFGDPASTQPVTLTTLSDDTVLNSEDYGPGVIGLWHFDGDGSDSSANNTDVIIARDDNVIGLYSGAGMTGFGQSLQGDGAAYVRTRLAKAFNMRTNIPPNPYYFEGDPADHMSVEAWIWIDSASANNEAYQIVSHQGNGQHGWNFRISNWPCDTSEACESNVSSTEGPWYAELQISVADNDPDYPWREAYSLTPLPTDEWVFLTATFDADTADGKPIKIYVNGEDQTEDDPTQTNVSYTQPQAGWPINVTHNPRDCDTGTCEGDFLTYGDDEAYFMRYLTIGAFGNICLTCTPTLPNPGGWPRAFVGRVDDVRLLNLTLTPAQIQTRYQNGLDGIPAPGYVE